MNALLWIDLLLAALLWVAFNVAVAGRKRGEVSRTIQIGIGFFAPGFVLGGLANLSIRLKFAGHAEVNWLGYTGSLLAVWVICATAITVPGMRRGRRRWTPAENWPRVGLAVATAMTLLVTAITLMRIDIAIMDRVSAIRAAAGRAMTAMVPEADPTAANAADVYSRAFNQLHADPEFQHAWDNCAQTEPDPAAIRALVLRRAETIALLRTASGMPYCRFDHDYSNFDEATLMPELGAGRRAQWLIGLAVSDELAKGQIAAATTDVSVMFRMSRQVAQVPIVLGGLVRGGLDQQAIYALADVLPEIQSTEQLDSIDIGPGELTDVVETRSIAGEEATVIGSITNFLTDSAYRRHRDQIHVPFVPPPVVRMYLVSDLDSYCAYMGQVRELANRPWMQTHVGPKGPAPPKVPLGLFGSGLRMDPGDFIRTMTLDQACHEAACSAVAIEHYRLDRGRWPAGLANLIPTYLAAIPIDPFTGKPMILAKKPDRWIIYSVGPDGKDDGGAEYNRRTKSGDVGFTLASQRAAPLRGDDGCKSLQPQRYALRVFAARRRTRNA